MEKIIAWTVLTVLPAFLLFSSLEKPLFQKVLISLLVYFVQVILFMYYFKLNNLSEIFESSLTLVLFVVPLVINLVIAIFSKKILT
jgi:hypothetical protein